MRTVYINVVGKPEGKKPLDISVDGRIILTCILNKQGMRNGLDSSEPKQRPVADPCEYDNEPQGYNKEYSTT
jgi:hypothetical protein